MDMFKKWIQTQMFGIMNKRQDPKGDRYRCLTELLQKMKKSKETDSQEISSTDPSVSRIDSAILCHTQSHRYFINSTNTHRHASKQT